LNTDDFMTLAELAIALAGFSSIVFVLQRDKGQKKPSYEIFALTRGILEGCLLVMIMSVLPVILIKCGVVGTDVWYYSSLSHAVVMILHGLLFVSLTSLARYSAIDSPTLRAFSAMPLKHIVPLLLGSSAILAVQIANVVGVFGVPIEGVYFGAIFTMLALIFVVFIVLLWSVIGQDDSS
jgi:hypothetical protein